MKQLGMYIHIPFCKRKCKYCDFSSYAQKDELISEYITCLKKELKEVGEGIKEQVREGLSIPTIIDTIYIGGGTPSYIAHDYIAQILEVVRQNFQIEKNAEITIEINPGTVDLKKLEVYKQNGINRCSIGLQAVNDELLEMLGRIHNKKEFVNTYELAKKAGFENINIDFMIGLPKQKMEDIEEMLELIEKLEPTHVSVYSLIVEEQTKLKEELEDGKLSLPEEVLERKMYWKVKEGLEEQGYEHYEISNFAKPTYASKHNLNCWNQKEYIGFGSSAHSYTDGLRYSNIANIEEYIENYKKDKQEDNIIFHEKQNEYTQMQEYMLLGLRKLKGVYGTEFIEKFGQDMFAIFSDQIKKLSKEELIEVNKDRIYLSNKGLDFANIVWEEFV